MDRSAYRLPAVAFLAAALGAGAVVAYRAAVPEPAGAACRAGGNTMARLELLLGLARKGGGQVSEAEWQAFLDTEVTPRFPDGLTVLAGQGQWRGSAGTITKEPSKVLLIWYRRGADIEGRIEAVRDAYKARFGQDSVMRVDGVSCVSF